MKNLKSTNLQLIGFFGTKKPIICKIVDSVHSSVNYILETVPYLSLVRWGTPGNYSNRGEILEHLGGIKTELKYWNITSLSKNNPLKE